MLKRELWFYNGPIHTNWVSLIRLVASIEQEMLIIPDCNNIDNRTPDECIRAMFITLETGRAG